MKRKLYDVVDEEFSLFLHKLNEKAEAKDMKYALVGGAAVQAHLANLLCKKYGESVEDLYLSDDVRLQDYIRATDDVDVCLPVVNRIEGNKKVNELLASLEEEVISPTEQHITRYSLDRTGIKKPIFRVEVDGKSSEESLIKLNFYTSEKDIRGFDAERYLKFVDNSKKISFPYNDNFNVKIKVASIEDVLAGKIARFGPKDAMDIWNLALLSEEAGKELDTEEIRRMLLPNHERFYNVFVHGLRVSQGKEDPINHPDLVNEDYNEDYSGDSEAGFS